MFIFILFRSVLLAFDTGFRIFDHSVEKLRRTEEFSCPQKTPRLLKLFHSFAVTLHFNFHPLILVKKRTLLFQISSSIWVKHQDNVEGTKETENAAIHRFRPNKTSPERSLGRGKEENGHCVRFSHYFSAFQPSITAAAIVANVECREPF